MAAEFCPRCSAPRVGSFRFCRSCQFDFDEAPVERPVPPSWQVVDRPASSSAGTAAPAEPVIETPIVARPKDSSSLAQKIVVVLIALAILIGGYVVLNGGRLPSSGGVASADVPPAGEAWFGSSFDATSFAIRGRSSTFGTTSPFSVVIHLTRPTDGSAMSVRAYWNGSLITTAGLSWQGTGDVWGTSLGPVFQAGTWRYEWIDVGGNVLASGQITAQ